MSGFIWTVSILIAISTLAKIVILANGNYEEPTPASLAMDVICNVILICWAAVLLS